MSACRRLPLIVVSVAIGLAGACSPDGGVPDPPNGDAPFTLATVADSSLPECSDRFEVIDLDHVVPLGQPEVSFGANGSGVALGDLDSDGRTDLVFGNVDGSFRIFWNRGELQFEAETIGSGRARSIQLIDYDGDADLDIVTAPGFGPPLLFVNQLVSERGPGRGFLAGTLPGVVAPAYSMLWLDPDRDGDLDLVTASYDMEFGRVIGGEYISEAENGVWYHERVEAGWVSSQLAEISHALAVAAVDLDGDGDDDLVVGNDFGLEDAIWLWDDGGWQDAGLLLPVTAANTMSFDAGDIDADGDLDLYATDMAPFDDSNTEFWQAMSAMEHDPPGPQLAENVLIDLGDEELANRAPDQGVDATGWSWSGRLLDLDNDRDLDLYVANGMLPSPLFPLMPDDELVEPNLAYRNVGSSPDGAGPVFERADSWGLDSTASTRAIAAADLDGDGALDLVTSTVGSPAQIFVNRLCDVGASIVIEPRERPGRSALGTVVEVATPAGLQVRTIASGVGYLAADPALAHIGLGEEDPAWVAVTWPDGERSVIEAPEPGRLIVTRSES